MHRRFAAPEVVVVHCGQVVVHERECVDEFDCDGGRVEPVRRDAEAFTGSIDQQRTHALAAIENGVTHRLVQSRGTDFRARQRSIQACVDTRRIGGNAGFEGVLHGNNGSVLRMCSVHGITRLRPHRAGL